MMNDATFGKNAVVNIEDQVFVKKPRTSKKPYTRDWRKKI
jgi:hypothetical protein